MADPIITIPQGVLKGCVGTNTDGGQFFKFFAIPYAKPPLGDLRFKAPLPPEKWGGVRDATQESTPCYSRCELTFGMVGSENCLFLNVYTKNISQQNLKPVMVFIYGGAFTVGSNRSAIYGPEVLLTEDIVLVTINYRIGLLGFMSLEDTSLEVPGNAGLKDQCMALKWIQNNINYFNGDPNNVTIFGESAGGSSVHYQILSPMANGLFQKAILQSGTALSPWALGQYPKQFLLKALDYDEKSDKELLDILQELPVEKLLEYQDKLGDGLEAFNIRLLAPIVEKPNKDAFLTEHPIELLSSGRYNHVPLIIGYTNKEGLFTEILKKIYPLADFDNWERSIPWSLNYPVGSDESKKLARRMRRIYNTGDANNDLYLLQTDVLFLIGIIASIKNHVKTMKCPVYFYRMSMFTKLNELNAYRRLMQLSDDVKGVCHGDDLCYLFKNQFDTVFENGSPEDNGRRQFRKLWVNFAKHGNPTPSNKNSNLFWKPVTKNSLNFFDIGEVSTCLTNPEPTRMKFWENVFKISPATSTTYL